MKLIVATSNQGKLREIRAMLAGHGVEVVGLCDLGEDFDIVEDGVTFLENARKKAHTIHLITGEVVLADDSGLEVEALGGEPGVYSARYAGPDASDAENNAKLLERMDGIPDGERSAAFVCSMVLLLPDGTELTAQGRLEGVIAWEPGGVGGFGYDPVFALPDRGVTLSRITPEEKNAVSHRGRALRAIIPSILAHAGQSGEQSP